MFYCPLCKKTVKHWLPYSSRKQVACPHCRSAERHRLTALYLSANKMFFDKLLHIAPERSLQNLFKSHSNEYICGDLDPHRYRDFNAVKLDATDMNNLKNDSFDCVYASHILEHIVEDRKAMSECYRVLKEGGVLIALIPQKFDLKISDEDYSVNTPEGRKERYGCWDHVRYYGLDFSERLKECGFHVSIYYIHKEAEKNIEKMVYDDKYLLVNDSNDSNDSNDYDKELLGSRNHFSKYNLNKYEFIYVCKKI
tara:strand:- start:46 stop:804 length:759 start_codon:yes stop_codon:yes gene_type:complete